ncbi:MAG: hypothetical protein ACI9UN_004829 [Granulosicoccus sp.]|jgi:hypothetical protein
MIFNKHNKRFARPKYSLQAQGSMLGIFIVIGLLANTQANAGVLEMNAVFSSEGQSMWEDANLALDFNIPIVDDIGWGRRHDQYTTKNSLIESFSSPEREILNPKWTAWKAKKTLHDKFPNTISSPGPAPVKKITIPAEQLGQYGATVKTASMGRFGVDIETSISGGSVDVNLPVFASFSYSDEAIIAGQSFTLSSSYTVGSDANISSISPNGYSNLVLDANMKIDASADVYLGSDEAADVNLFHGIDVDARFAVLGLDATESGDGLEFLSTPLDAVDEMLVSAGIQEAQFYAEQKVDAEGAEAESKKAQQELAAANKELIEAEAESKQIEKEQTQAEKDIAKNDVAIEKAEGVITSYDNQISANNAKTETIEAERVILAEQELSGDQRQAQEQEKSDLAAENKKLEEDKAPGYEIQIAENNKKQENIDDDLSFDDYVKNEGQKLDTEKARLAKENEGLDSRRAATNTSKQQSKTKKEQATTRVDDAKQRKTVADTKKDDAKSKRDDKLETAKTALKKNNKAKKLDISINKIADAVTDSIQADWSIPVVETISDVASATGVLKASGEDQFVEMLLGIDELLTLAAKTGLTAATGGTGALIIFRLPGLSDEIELTDYLRAEYAVLDLNVGARGYVTQSLNFEPKFEVSLDIGTGTPIVFDLGTDVEIMLPEDAENFVFTPTIKLKKSTFTNTMGIRIEPTAELAAMAFVAGVTPPPELANSVNKYTEQDLIEAFSLPAAGCIPIPRQQGGAHGGSPGGSPLPPTTPHNCEDKYPLAGTIDGLDLVPEEYALEEFIEISPYSNSWQLGGFEESVGESVSINVATTTTLPGATFDILTDDWNTFGNVVVQDGVVQLTTASPVSLFTTIDTDNQPFHLLFDYRFEDQNGGWLSIFLDDVYLDAIQAISSADFLTASIYIDDMALLGRSNLTLEFEYLDVTGSQVYLDNIRRIENTTVPAPPTVIMFLMGLVALVFRSQKG